MNEIYNMYRKEEKVKEIIVLFGAGRIGQKILPKVKELIDETVIYCDNDVKRHNTKIHGVMVIGFEGLLELYKTGRIKKIIITTELDREILYQCISAGISTKKLYCWDMRTGTIRPISEKHTMDAHSQDGEEFFLKEYFLGKDRGTYVDIGAYHPFRFSNTYWAYSGGGWRGINIEPDIINYELLKTFRKDDININCGITDRETQLDYYMFQETGLNTFCTDEIENREDVIGIRKVPMRRLDSILAEYNIQEVDFMDIDVEGMELQVLNSIDWNKVKIKCLLVEQRNMSLHDVLESEVCKLLEKRGYSPVSKYNRTVIYLPSESKF